MRLTKIKILQYKNIEESYFSPNKNINAFTGKNGMGKTNILDAIHYLCLSKSNFGRLERNNVKIDCEFFRLEGSFTNEEKKYNIVVKVKPPRIKTIEKNKKIIDKISDHIGQFPLVIIAPRDKNALLESSKERRKLMDRALSQTDKKYLNSLVEYNKLLRQRNALLKNSVNGIIDMLLLKSYDKRMAPLVSLISFKRKDFVNQLVPDFLAMYEDISSGQEIPKMIYSSTIEDDNYLDLVEESLQKDMILKRSNIGIHKDDLTFIINDRKLKYFASQGQLKSFALAIKLAEFSFLKRSKGFVPIVILDDVFDKLDKTRVKKLVALLFKDKFGQVFISDTDKDRVEKIFLEAKVDYNIFEVENGVIYNEIISSNSTS